MGAAHGMADVVAVHKAFPADFTILAHVFSLPELVADVSIASFAAHCKPFFEQQKEISSICGLTAARKCPIIR